MIKSIIFGLLIAAIAVPVKAQTTNIDWISFGDGVAMGVDLASVKSRSGTVVSYDYWMVVNNVTIQTSQIAECDGSNLVTDYWIRKWEGNKLIESRERNVGIRTAKTGGIDELFITTACKFR